MTKVDLKAFEERFDCKLLLLTPFGSRLYGTNDENSDEDYKGVFVQNPKKFLVKRDLDHYTFSTGSDNAKNDKSDVDVQLYSVQKFFSLLSKGETGALDLLFAAVNGKSLYMDREFKRLVVDRYEDFLSNKLQAFVGYCIGQSKKYGLKGTRYKELTDFLKFVKRMPDDDERLERYFTEFNDMKYNHIFMTRAAGPKTSRNMEIDYVSVLGKLFSGDVKVSYFKQKVKDLEKQFGDRTKMASEGVDFKALSHAVRVISEVEELLTAHRITFPLLNADYVKAVKQKRVEVKDVMEFLEEKLEVVQNLMEESDLPASVDRNLLDEKVLDLYETHYKDCL
jgi:hypothetical protein